MTKSTAFQPAASSHDMRIAAAASSSVPPETPSSNSQLTPQSGSSQSGNDDSVAVNVVGRGLNLQKIQTDLSGDHDGDDAAGPDAPLMASENNRDRGDGLNDSVRDSLELYTDTPGRHYVDELGLEAYSARSYTAEEEARVVKKFDRRLTLLMAFLYMLSFLDRSSKCIHQNCPIYPIESEISQVLTSLSRRHWECENSWHERRPTTIIIPVRMGAHSLLYHLYRLRMDDSHVQNRTSTYIHTDLRFCMGPLRVAAMSCRILRRSRLPKSPVGHLRSSLWTWSPFLPILFL